MIKRIIAETGDSCEVDVEILHNTLLNLPAEKYLELYHKMQGKIIQPYYMGCCPTEIGETAAHNGKENS